MPSRESMECAAQCWCDPETEHIEMDVDLATAFARRLDELKAERDEAVRLLREVMPLIEPAHVRLAVLNFLTKQGGTDASED